MNRRQPISTLMQRPVNSAGFDDTLAAVRAQMSAKNLSWLPVVEANGTPLGVISATDLLRLHAEGKDPDTTRAWQLCSYKPLCVTPDTSLGEVARRMVEQHIHHVAVVDATGLVGVVSSLDFVRSFATPAPD